MSLGDRVLQHAECIQSLPKEFGCFFSRFHLIETLKQNEHVTLLQILDQLEAASKTAK